LSPAPLTPGLGIEDHGVCKLCQRRCSEGGTGGEAAGVCNELHVFTLFAVQLGDAVRGHKVIRVGNAIDFLEGFFRETVVRTQIDDFYAPREQFSRNRHCGGMRDRKERNIHIDLFRIRVLEDKIGKSLEVGMDLV